ncbi:MAG: uroporphyrinogen-III decarboxylase-like protein [Chloroflexi bacterium]|nr:uroporphyrinogen-III decarboxylase-like protein [Chloroflexota bacterium]
MVTFEHTPDFGHLRRTLLRQGPPGRVPFIELFADVPIMEAVVGEKFPEGFDRESRARACDLTIQFYRQLGYDYVCAILIIPLNRALVTAEDTAVSGSTRYWQNENMGVITSWEEFESYPWPSVDDIDYWAIEYTAQHLPEGMQVIAQSGGGVLEWVMWMMGYQPFAFALMEQPDLIEAMFAKIEELTTAACANAVDIPGVGAYFFGDDMGFTNSTMISPRHLRQYVFPIQKKLVDITHAKGLPFLLHSCGNITAIMDDLIDYVGIDGKHSFQDKIMPVEEASRRWGDRISMLGGVDMDVLGRGTEEEVRARTRQILDFCGPRGGYCLGSGNSVASYIPVRNYLAMLDEGYRWNQEHFGQG